VLRIEYQPQAVFRVRQITRCVSSMEGMLWLIPLSWFLHSDFIYSLFIYVMYWFYLSIYLFIYLSFYLFIYLFIYLFLYFLFVFNLIFYSSHSSSHSQVIPKQYSQWPLVLMARRWLRAVATRLCDCGKWTRPRLSLYAFDILSRDSVNSKSNLVELRILKSNMKIIMMFLWLTGFSMSHS
jgi:hypothetical protein